MVFIHLGKVETVARRTVTVFIDDMTGEEITDVRHVEFAFRGVEYRLDLSPESFVEMQEVFAPWVENATRVPKRRRAKRDLNDVRAWAKANGFEVSDKGRVPKKVLDAYDAR